jgi:hypothetical protein
MLLRRRFVLVPGALAALGLLVACTSTGVVDPGDGGFNDANPKADGGTKNDGAPPTECPPGSRLFNGDCHVICTKGADCEGGTHCIAVDDEEAMCLPYETCGYFGSDTQCVAYGGWYSYSPRGGGATFYPYESTPGADPNDISSKYDPYFKPDPYWATTGPCQGNAKWITVAAKGDVSCNATHEVERCRFNWTYHRCELGTGFTREFVEP